MNNSVCNLCFNWKQASLLFLTKKEPSAKVNPTTQSLKKDKLTQPAASRGSLNNTGGNLGRAEYILTSSLKICIAILNWDLRVSLKKKPYGIIIKEIKLLAVLFY